MPSEMESVERKSASILEGRRDNPNIYMADTYADGTKENHDSYFETSSHYLFQLVETPLGML